MSGSQYSIPALRPQSRGFTMVELMAVVAIVGILGAIAMVSYRKYIKASKATEAIGNVGHIKMMMEEYRSDQMTYYSVSPDLASSTSFHPPNPSPGKYKMNWTTAGPTKAGWDRIGVNFDAPVYFVYGCTAGPAGAAVTATGSDITIGNWPSTTPNAWYVIKAKADLDNNGTTVFVAGSFAGEIYSANYE